MDGTLKQAVKSKNLREYATKLLYEALKKEGFSVTEISTHLVESGFPIDIVSKTLGIPRDNLVVKTRRYNIEGREKQVKRCLVLAKQGYSYSEIGRKVGISSSLVRRYILREGVSIEDIENARIERAKEMIRVDEDNTTIFMTTGVHKHMIRRLRESMSKKKGA